MRKRVRRPQSPERAAEGTWLDLERAAQVELTSEDARHPIELALLGGEGPGWRAAEPGEQTIRILFDQPQRLRRIRLRFLERAAERTQEFVLRWSGDQGRTFRDIVRQQYTFSPGGATAEVEDYRVDLRGVTTLELTILPDQGRGEAYASLAGWEIG